MTILHVLEHYGLLDTVNMMDSLNIKVLCPFHSEKAPSLSINVNKGSFYCYGCQASGNTIDFIARIENIDTFSAMRKLVKITKGMPKHVIIRDYEPDYEQYREEAFDYFSTLPVPNWETIQSHYMFDRGFTVETLKHFDVRLNPVGIHPVIIPLYENGNFQGYVCRRTDSEEDTKYLYSKGFRRKDTLIGNLKKGLVLVTEGMFDYMKAWQFGFKNSCPLLGWKASEYHIHTLRKYTDTLIVALDNTKTGRQGLEFLSQYFKCKRFRFPKEIKDLGEMSSFEFNRALARTLKAVC